MIKKIKKCVFISIVIGVICFITWLISNPRRIISITYELGYIYSNLSLDWDHYTNPFYMKLKIPIDMKISNVEKKWGKALDVTYVDDGEKSPIYIYRYDGFYIMSEAAIAKGAEPRIMVVVVDSDKYKFTYKHLGLGSPKSDVEKWGKHKMKLLDTEPNELGYILGYSYVIFTIDENDCVKEISFTS